MALTGRNYRSGSQGGSGFRGSNLGPMSPSNMSQPTYGPSPATYMAAMNPFQSQQFSNQRSDLRSDYQMGLAQLGADRSAARADLGRLSGDQANALAMLGIDTSRIGLNRERLGLERDRLGLSREGLDIDESDARRGARMDRIGTESEYTGRGAWFAPMLGIRRDDIAAGLTSDLGRIDLSRQGIDIDEQGLGIDERGLGLDEREVGLRRQQTRRDFDAQRDQLQRTAQQYGLDERQLREQLDRGLRDLGLQENMSAMDLFGQSDPQSQAQAEALIEWALGGSQGAAPLGPMVR